jgi:hypothetical protein
MRLKHGKKYETADGDIYQVILRPDGCYGTHFRNFEVWTDEGIGINTDDLICRNYTNPKPAHKLDLKPGDVVELMAWEDGCVDWIGARLGHESAMKQPTVKGRRPLFRVVSRASWTMPPS